MDPREIYSKTDAGREEIRTRALRLPGALRNLLLLVDGQRSLGQLKELISGGKAPPDAIEQLIAQGLIERVVEPPSVVAAPEPAASGATAATTPPLVAAAATASATEGLSNEATRRFNRLYNVMNEITRDYLGLRGVFMQLKIEKCASAEELLDLQEELGAAIAKAHNRSVSAELIARIQAAA